MKVTSRVGQFSPCLNHHAINIATSSPRLIFNEKYWLRSWKLCQLKCMNLPYQFIKLHSLFILLKSSIWSTGLESIKLYRFNIMWLCGLLYIKWFIGSSDTCYNNSHVKWWDSYQQANSRSKVNSPGVRQGGYVRYRYPGQVSMLKSCREHR